MTTKYECLGDAWPFPNDQEDAPAPEGAGQGIHKVKYFNLDDLIW